MKKIIKSVLLSSAVILTACTNLPYLNTIGPSHYSDGNITASVQASLDRSQQFVGIPVTIQTQNRQVSLSGYVKTIRQSDVAEELASKVAGVIKVENHLIVRK